MAAFISVRTEHGHDLHLNPDNIVEIRDYPAKSERVVYDEEEDRDVTLRAEPRRLGIVTIAQTSEYDSGGDFPEFAHTEYHPYVVRLQGDQAEEFMSALPVGPAPDLRIESGRQ